MNGQNEPETKFQSSQSQQLSRDSQLIETGFWGEITGWHHWDYPPPTEAELKAWTEQIKKEREYQPAQSFL